MSIFSRKFWLSLTAKALFVTLLIQIVFQQSSVHAMYDINNNNNESYCYSDSDSDDSSYSDHSDTDDEYEYLSDSEISDSEMNFDVDEKEFLKNADKEEFLKNADEDLSVYRVDQKLTLKKSDKRFKSSSDSKTKRMKQKQELRRKQMLCIFLCVLIVGGAILVPSFIPFLYIFKGSSNQEPVFDAPSTSVQLQAFDSSLASLKELQGDNYNLVCSEIDGGKTMCCGVKDNNALRCCLNGLCKEVEFNSSPKNSYQISRDGIKVDSTDRIVSKFVSFKEHESFDFYNALNDLGYYCKNGEAPADVIDKVHSKIFGTMEKIIAKMPSLQKCLKSFTFVCSDLSEIYFNPDGLRKSKKGLYKDTLIAVKNNVYINPEECKIEIGLDWKKLTEAKLTDNDLSRVIGHELGHVLQGKNYKKYFLTSEAEFGRYLIENIEIEADLVSQLSTKYVLKNSGGIASYLVALEFYEDLFSSGPVLFINKDFKCFDEVKKLRRNGQDSELYVHPPLVCRIAFGLSLAEAQEEINALFGI